jgi:hypothetical protein
MRVLVLALVLALSGCANSGLFRPYANQYRSYDPCIKCGERFQQIPNFENEAIIRRNRGEIW